MLSNKARRKLLPSGRNIYDFPSIPFNFWQELVIYYHSRFADEPKGTIKSNSCFFG